MLLNTRLRPPWLPGPVQRSGSYLEWCLFCLCSLAALVFTVLLVVMVVVGYRAHSIRYVHASAHALSALICLPAPMYFSWHTRSCTWPPFGILTLPCAYLPVSPSVLPPTPYPPIQPDCKCQGVVCVRNAHAYGTLREADFELRPALSKGVLEAGETSCDLQGCTGPRLSLVGANQARQDPRGGRTAAADAGEGRTRPSSRCLRKTWV